MLRRAASRYAPLLCFGEGTERRAASLREALTDHGLDGGLQETALDDEKALGWRVDRLRFERKGKCAGVRSRDTPIERYGLAGGDARAGVDDEVAIVQDAAAHDRHVRLELEPFRRLPHPLLRGWTTSKIEQRNTFDVAGRASPSVRQSESVSSRRRTGTM